MTDIYKPRFTNELASTGNPIVDAEMRNVTYEDGSPSREWEIEQNGGDEPSGDASTRKDEGALSAAQITSPTYTREELVEVIANANRTITRNGIQLSIPRSLLCAVAALDALIAIGAVRVK